MKLLAVFGLALAVVAVDKTASDCLLKAATGNPVSDLEALSKDSGCKICEAVEPEEVFPLISDCLETGESLLPSSLEMDIVHLAAFIFMLRAQSNEKVAKGLYDLVMKKRFSEQFEDRLHEEPYTPTPLLDFNCLTGKPERQSFFVLWTVQMYDKGIECKNACRKRLLKDSEVVAWILARMGFPPKVLIAAIIASREKLLAGTAINQFSVFQQAFRAGLLADMALRQFSVTQQASREELFANMALRQFSVSQQAFQGGLLADMAIDSFSVFQQAFLSFTRSDYLGLEEQEKAQLLAFLEKYLKARWKCLGLSAEGLSNEEFEQFQDVFGFEDGICCVYRMPDMIDDFAEYLGKLIQLKCPIFLPKKRLDFYSEEESLTTKEILRRRHYLLEALEIVKKAYLGKGLDCSQIKRAIEECKLEIESLEEKYLAALKEEPKEEPKEDSDYLDIYS